MALSKTNSVTNYPWHQKSWNHIVQARKNNHLPHAILLSGETGIGKQILANKMVKSLLCMNPQNYEACNNCQACKTYDSGANPDYINIELLEEKQQISVDQIRNLSEFLNYSRSFNTYRVALINPVERMNQNAANSLLKSLEEPASNSIIILIATQLSKILPTIKSRCQLLSLPTPTREQSLSWLVESSPQLENPELLLEMASGKPLLAIDIKQEDIDSRAEFEADVHSVVTANHAIIEIAKKWEKYNAETLLNWQLLWIQDIIKNTQCNQATIDNSGKNPVQNYPKTLSKLSDTMTIEQMWLLYQQLLKQKQYIHTSVNPLMYIENMLLLWLQASHTHT